MREDAPTKSCPFCAETILRAAAQCRHCGSMVLDRGWRTIGMILLGLTTVVWGLLALVMVGMLAGVALGATWAAAMRELLDAGTVAFGIWAPFLAACLIAGWVGLSRRRGWAWGMSGAALAALIVIGAVAVWTKGASKGLPLLAVPALALLCIGKAGADAGAWRRTSPAFWAGAFVAVMTSAITASMAN